MNFGIGQVGIPAGIFKPSPPAQSFANRLDGRLAMEENITEFLNKTADLSAELHKRKFITKIDLNLMCMAEIESPIEKMFFIALHGYAELFDLTIFPIHSDFVITERNSGTIHLCAQKVIGDYRVDFLISHIDINDNKIDLIVELDGHAFHDKNKEQRAYEKARDRYFSRNGFKTLHFTGSEVFRDPFKCVLEAFSVLEIAHESLFIKSYNPSDPFMLEVM